MARLLRVGCSMAAVTVATLAMLPFRSETANANLALVLVVVVLATALVAGRPGGIAAAAAAAVMFDLLLTRPYRSLRIASRTDVATTVLLGVIGLIAGELVDRARRNGARAASAAAALRSVYDRAELAAGSEDSGRLIAVTVDELTRMFHLRSCRYIAGPLPAKMAELTHRGVRIPAGADPATRELVALPVRAHGSLLGNLVMTLPVETSATRMSSDERHAAVALADQLGVGLLRFR